MACGSVLRRARGASNRNSIRKPTGENDDANRRMFSLRPTSHPELQATLTPELRRLLALDDPENDALCQGDYVRSGFLK
jgi:hypothetical protein